jgi:predicted nucleic acid-binding protein
MSAKPFLDTNVLIYAFATSDPRKAACERLLAQGGVVSVQILNEFANVSHRKLALGWDEIAKRIETVKALVEPPVALSVDIHDAARDIARTRKIAFYDALVVAAALAANCAVLMTEDLQPGAKFGSLEVRNPFIAP